MPKSGTLAVWFRNDLRLHDNVCLNKAVQLIKSSQTIRHVLPVYFYDDRFIGSDAVSSQIRVLKTGAFRERFISDSVIELRARLQKIGSNLLICYGRPEKLFNEFLPVGSTILTQDEVAQEEIAIDNAVKRQGFDLQKLWGFTLYHPQDLGKTNFSSATALVKTATPSPSRPPKVLPRQLLPKPTKGQLPFPPDEDGKFTKYLEQKPVLSDAAKKLKHDPRGVFGEKGFVGGEKAGKARVDYYCSYQTLLDDYKDTRNGMLGPDYSSKFSAWLAHGCVSPRYVYHKVKEHEEKAGGPNKGTGHLIFELVWRDYFVFYLKTHNPKVFFPNGVVPRRDITWSYDKENFRRWCDGETGFPLVDANMLELKHTGFMSNRGRQNVASFLVFNLQIDWRWGAEYFESLLIDHHVTANWGNWVHAAGLTGSRLNIFNITRQAASYDDKGEYVRTWIPALKDVPDRTVHEPWKFGASHTLDYVKSRIGDANYSGGAKGNGKGNGNNNSNSSKSQGRSGGYADRKDAAQQKRGEVANSDDEWHKGQGDFVTGQRRGNRRWAKK